jgi:Ca-activated chloride channel family protein
VTSGSGPVRLDATLDRGAVLRGGDGRVRVELSLRGEARAGAADLPTDLVVVLDRSGSMDGEPLRFAREAVRELLSQLSERDRFALVTYASGAGVSAPLEAATASARRRWRRAVEAVEANGGTNLASGLDLAHQLVSGADFAGRAVRVVVLSDGHANQGDHSLEGLRARARRALGGEYVLSAVGVGQGFDETLMSALADAGTGNFYYLPHLRALAGVFADEFASARETIASALRVSIEPGDGVRVESAAGYPLSLEQGRVQFEPGSLFAGQERRIWLSLRVPTALAGDVTLGRVRVSYRDERGAAREVALPRLPALACVEGEHDYYASFHEGAYRRGLTTEAFGALKQRVAGKLKAGRVSEAAEEIEVELDELRREQRRALGSVADDDVAELEALRDAVSAPSVASPAERNRLGKQLLEQGRDARRSGAKRH